MTSYTVRKAQIAFDKAKERLLKATPKQISLLNNNPHISLSNSDIETVANDSFDHLYYESVDIAGISFGDKKLIGHGRRTTYNIYLGKGFLNQTEDAQEKIMLHELGHAVLKDISPPVEDQSLTLLLTKTLVRPSLIAASFIAPTVGLPLLGLSIGINRMNSHLSRFKEKKADFNVGRGWEQKKWEEKSYKGSKCPKHDNSSIIEGNWNRICFFHYSAEGPDLVLRPGTLRLT